MGRVHPEWPGFPQQFRPSDTIFAHDFNAIRYANFG